jgi:hypothetical protein
MRRRDGRAKHAASDSKMRRVSLEACEPNHMAAQWLTFRRLPYRPITNLPAELFRPPMVSVKLPKSEVSGFSSL